MKIAVRVGIGVAITIAVIFFIFLFVGMTQRMQELETPQQTTSEQTTQTKILQSITQSCSGNARCISGQVTKIVDGDTIHVNGQSIRFALSSTPELNEFGGLDAKHFVEQICPVGSKVLVDEDDGQTEGSHGRIIGVIYCNGINLNEAIIEEGHAYLTSGYCYLSEFSTHVWTQKHGCASGMQKEKLSEIETEPKVPKQNNCDPSYPDVCISPWPPDLNCGEIQYRNFEVLTPDPHRFDGDKDGIGCES